MKALLDPPLLAEEGFDAHEIQGAGCSQAAASSSDETVLSTFHPRFPAHRFSVLTGVYFAASCGLHLVSQAAVDAVLPSHIMGAMDPIDARLYFAEHVVSAVHGVACGVLSAWAIGGPPGLGGSVWNADVIRPYPLYLDHVYACHAGYTLYDMITMAIHGGESREMWLHHGIGLLGSVLIPAFRTLGLLPTVFMATELTVLPQNALWFAQRLRLSPTSHLYRILLFFRALSYLFLRAPSLAFVFKYATDRNLTPAKWARLPPYAQALFGLNILALGSLNFSWSRQGLRTYLKSLLSSQ